MALVNGAHLDSPGFKEEFPPFSLFAFCFLVQLGDEERTQKSPMQVDENRVLAVQRGR